MLRMCLFFRDPVSQDVSGCEVTKPPKTHGFKHSSPAGGCVWEDCVSMVGGTYLEEVCHCGMGLEILESSPASGLIHPDVSRLSPHSPP